MSIFGPGGKQEKDLTLETKYEDAENWQHGIVGSPEEAGSLEEHLATKRSRMRYLVVLLLAAFLVISFKLYDLQVVRGDEYRQMAEGNRVRNKVIRADRGVILDRTGAVLAQNKGSFDLVIVPFDLPNKKEERKTVYANLSIYINMEASLIEKKVDESEKKNSVFDPVLIQENLPREQALLVETKHSSLTGVTVEKNSVRDYVDGPVFAQALGYTGKISADEYETRKDKYSTTDYIGKMGVESVYEEDLRGKFGKEQIEVDASGSLKRILAQVAPESGYKLVTSLDAGLQKVMYDSLVKSMESVGAKSAAAVATNPKTGEILALISMPSYDNNLFAKGINPQDYATLMNDPEKPMFNRVISGTYPPGSTIKMVTATAGLSEGIITADTVLQAPGALKIVNPYDPNVVWYFKDWKTEGFGSISTRDAIAWSSDVFFYQVGGGYGDFKGLGLQKLREWDEKFGIERLMSIDLPGEAEGLVPSEAWKKRQIKEDWYLGDTYNMAIGQGYLLATPMQICSITSTVANGGNIMWPHVGKQILDVNGRVVREIQPKILKEKVAAPEVLQIVREGMAGSASYGTSRWMQYLPVKAAGKTGTAQFPGDEPGHEHAWYTAFAPYDDPQIAITVLVEKGGEGSTASVPVVYDAMNYYFSR